jgi:hypothetical protein
MIGKKSTTYLLKGGQLVVSKVRGNLEKIKED